MATARELSAEDVARYRAAARLRYQAERRALVLREQLAWELAGRAASLLRDRFQARRVVAFGSLVHPGCFTEWSDVDIAAWGINPRDTLRAIGMVMGLEADHDWHRELLRQMAVEVPGLRPQVMSTETVAASVGSGHNRQPRARRRDGASRCIQ